MNLETGYRIVVKAIYQWIENGDSRLAAALAYYALFSMAPLLLLSITVVGMICGEEQVRENLYRQMERALGQENADAVKFLVEHASRPHGPGGVIASLAVMLIGAMGMFLHMRSSLSTIWKLEPPKGNTYLGMALDYALAMAMVVVFGFLLLGMVVAATAVEYVEQHMPDNVIPWRLVDRAGSVILLAVLFTAVYRVMSANRMSWGYIIYGAIIASILFTVGKALLAYYFFYFSPSGAYGAAGSVMVFLVWVYYSSYTLFFGAELIQARRTRFEWLKNDVS